MVEEFSKRVEVIETENEFGAVTQRVTNVYYEFADHWTLARQEIENFYDYGVLEAEFIKISAESAL